MEAAIAGRFENAGRACNAAKRFIVVADVYDEFLDKFTKKVLEARRRSGTAVVAGRRGSGWPPRSIRWSPTGPR